MIENRKLEYYKKKLLDVQKQSKDEWRIMNEIIRKKRSKKIRIKQVIDSTGKTVTSREGVANAFNSYFVNVGKNLASITLYDYVKKFIVDVGVEEIKNPDHTYALQPIVLKIANKDESVKMHGLNSSV